MKVAYSICTAIGFLFLVVAIGARQQTNAMLSSVITVGTPSTSTVVMVPGDGGCVTVGSLASSTIRMLCGGTKGQLDALVTEYGEEQRSLGTKEASVTKVSRLAKAISQHETGHRNVPGQTGELATRYQFMPATWASLAKKYLGNGNAPTTDENQDRVAKAYISDLFSQGYDAQQIAMIWNGGKPYRRTGTVKTKAGKTIKYDTAAYASKVISIYKNL